MWVVKVGGSVLDRDDHVLDGVLAALARIADYQRLLLVAGGGMAADLIRILDARQDLPELASHLMSVLAMEMNAAKMTEACPEMLHLTREPILGSAGYVPVLLPLEMVLGSALPSSWDVTSDTVAAYAANIIGAKLALLKDVDGVLDTWPTGRVLDSITPAQLSCLSTSPVDPFLPKFLAEKHMEAWVLNGLRPERLESLISGRRTLCTRVHG